MGRKRKTVLAEEAPEVGSIWPTESDTTVAVEEPEDTGVSDDYKSGFADGLKFIVARYSRLFETDLEELGRIMVDCDLADAGRNPPETAYMPLLGRTIAWRDAYEKRRAYALAQGLYSGKPNAKFLAEWKED